jgi:flagellin
MIINHNIASLNTYRQLSSNNVLQNKSLEKLSSGLRINRAGDDAAGLAISEKMRGQIRGLDQASRNAQDGISLIQTAEGALNETHSILQRMRELAVQSSNDTYTSADRFEIQKEVDQLAVEITRIANNTEFNTQKLLNGGITTAGIGENVFQIGANANQSISINVGAMDAKTLGVSRDIVVSATGTVGVDADLASATFSGTFGNGIVNGNVATIAYTAAVPGDAGSVSEVTGASNFASASLAAINADTSMTITVGATTYTIDNAALKSWDNAVGHQTIGDAMTFLGAASDGGTGTLADVATISNNGTNITITLNNPGATPLTVNYSGTDAATVAGVFGMANGLTDTGDAVVQAASARYDITSSVGFSQTVTISDPTATSITISSGNFSGMTLNADVGKTLADIDGATVTIATISSVSAAATFSNGALVDEAVTLAGIDVSSHAAANTAIDVVQAAITTVSAERSKLGAYQNRLEHTINNLQTSSENLTASESRIRDVDMAKEMMEFTKMNILSQAATAMLAQANQTPQNVLQLLR